MQCECHDMGCKAGHGINRCHGEARGTVTRLRGDFKGTTWQGCTECGNDAAGDADDFAFDRDREEARNCVWCGAPYPNPEHIYHCAKDFWTQPAGKQQQDRIREQAR